MLRRLVVFALIACLGLTACSSSWEQSVERAAERDEPLVIEFYADWCKPCRRFEKVLTDPEVKAALSGIALERYDFDSTAGQYHARRLGVSGVPTVLAVGRDGRPVGGLKGAVGKETFLAFLQWTREQWAAAAPTQ